jgi:hypothetical protein
MFTDPSGQFSLLEISVTIHMQMQLLVAAHPVLIATASALLTTVHLISLIVDPEYRHDAYAMGPLGADAQLATKLIGRSSKFVRGVPTYISIMRGRNAYVSAVKNLSLDLMALRAEGRPIKEIAIIMNDKRRNLGKIFKDATPDNLREYIRLRNLDFYQDELGPTIEWFRKDGRSWERIAEGAARPGGLDIDFGKFAFE